MVPIARIIAIDVIPIGTLSDDADVASKAASLVFVPMGLQCWCTQGTHIYGSATGFAIKTYPDMRSSIFPVPTQDNDVIMGNMKDII